jgi:hypothetical protein
MTSDHPSVVICIPVFNDAKSAALLLERLDAVAASLPYDFAVVFVDDGSRHEECAALPGPTPHIPAVEVLRLRRNLGHQRAIAIGLSFIAAETDADYAVVMDGDGEDCPSSLPQLLAAAVEGSPHAAVFAERLKRHDGAGFMLGYHAFRILHKLFVGRDIKVGNFSVLPRPVLERVVGISEIWNHYAAGVFHARIPVVQVPIARGRRLAGESKMNLPALVMHGICALSVWSDVIVSRLFVLVVGVMAASVAVLVAIVVSRLVANPFTPGWATAVASLLILGMMLLGVVSLLLALFVLGNRSGANFLPHRDWRDYVLPEGRPAPANSPGGVL